MLAIVARGVTALVAASFARIFFRNAVNLGLPAIECPDAWQHVADGDEITIDLASGSLTPDGGRSSLVVPRTVALRRRPSGRRGTGGSGPGERLASLRSG